MGGWLYALELKPMSDGVRIRKGPAHTFGWQRRKDQDSHAHEVWEKPDGELIAYPRGAGEPTIVKFEGFSLDSLASIVWPFKQEY